MTLPDEDSLSGIGRGFERGEPSSGQIPIPAPHNKGVQAWNERNVSPVPISALKWNHDWPWVWHGFLARGHTTLLAGAPKSGKTTLLAHLLKLMAQGGELGGSVAPARVLVVSEESARLWARRRDDLGLEDHVHMLCRPFMSKPSPDEWEEYVQEVAEVARDTFEVVVFDTLASLWPVQCENDAADVLESLSPLNAITESGAAVLLVHHLRKSNGGEAMAVRGSSALAGWVDAIVELRRFSPEAQDDRRRVFRAYTRFVETPPETVLELGDGEYRAIGTKTEATRAERFEVIRKLLSPDGPGDSVDDVREKWPDELPTPGRRIVAFMVGPVEVVLRFARPIVNV